MKKITATSQRGQHIIASYQSSHITSLSQAYAYSYSSEKAEAFKRCEDLMHELGGSDLRITGHNGNFFSVGFVYTDKETGEKRLAYITHAGDYYVPYKGLTIEEFEKRWNENVTDDIKERTARALGGRIITSEEEAEGVLGLAEAFSQMQRLFGGR